MYPCTPLTLRRVMLSILIAPSRPGTLWIFSMMRASPKRSMCNFDPLAAEDDFCRGHIGRTDFAVHRVPEQLRMAVLCLLFIAAAV